MTRWDLGHYQPRKDSSIAPEVWEKLLRLEGCYPWRRGMLVPALMEVAQHHKWVSRRQMEELAEFCEVSPTEVLGVATFYTMIYTSPVGDYNIQVCRTLSCALCGAEKLIEHLKEKLGIDEYETTPDGRFTLTPVECLAACCGAPVVQINQDYYENVTPEKLDEILESLPQERTLNPKGEER